MSGRYLLGLLLLLLGAGYLLQELNIIGNFSALLRLWWPVLVILLGLNGLIRHLHRPWGALTIVLIGALLLLWRLGLLPRNLWALAGALLLIVIGLRLLLPRRSLAPRSTVQKKDRITDSVSFGSIHFCDESPQFKGGRISTSFGNYELDLRGAELAPDGADLDLSASFGGIEVRVPDHWPVVATGAPVFGSCVNKAQQTTNVGQPALRVKCSAQFGSIEITN